jgi:succinate dehydrogenase/fumarate reductase-like Fe-S protein
VTIRTARLHIRRGTPGAPARTEIFAVPFTPGQSLLDGLRWIRATQDPSLAVRFSCINANACKECMIELEGRTTYACTERLREGDMHVAPLSNKALVHDLITEIAPRDERLLD